MNHRPLCIVWLCIVFSCPIFNSMIGAEWAAAQSPEEKPEEKPEAPPEAPPSAQPPQPALPKIRISKETTWLDGPLDADGMVDYLQALNDKLSQGVTPENNFAVTLWRAAGPGEELQGEAAERYFKMLGVPAPPPEGDYLIGLLELAQRKHGAGAAAVLEQWEAQQQEAMEKPWKADAYPILADWLSVNERPLEAVKKGLRTQPRYYSPAVDPSGDGMLINVVLPHLSTSREFARLLGLRAMQRIAAGQLREAREDLADCHLLARRVGQGTTMIDALVAIAIDSVACEGDVHLAQHPALTGEQALEYRRELEQTPPMQTMVDCLNWGERLFFLNSAQAIACGRQGAHDMIGKDSPLRRIALASIDWNEPLKMGNRLYDQMVAAIQQQDYKSRQRALGEFEDELKKVTTEARQPGNFFGGILRGKSPATMVGRQIGAILTALLIPAVSAAQIAEDRNQATWDATRLALTLAAYQRKHGKYPDSLDELTPDWIDAIPVDRFSGKPLHYQRRGAGAVLYSVGPNLIDENGVGYGSRHRTADEDDVGVTLLK